MTTHAALINALKKVARENPETRATLVPLIKKASTNKEARFFQDVKRAIPQLTGELLTLEKHLEFLQNYADRKISRYSLKPARKGLALLKTLMRELDQGFTQSKKFLKDLTND